MHRTYAVIGRTLISAAVIACAAQQLLSRTPTLTAGSASGRKIVLIGLDGADWNVVDRLAKASTLPTFARLRASGRTGVLAATPPLVSPIIWTSIATGLEPENHGVLDFMVSLAAGGQAPVGSTQRLAPALWTLFSNAGRSVGIVGWWATWPAEQVRGTIVSDALAPQLTRTRIDVTAGLVSPASATASVLQALRSPTSLTRNDLAAYVPIRDEELAGLRRSYSAEAGSFYKNPLAHLAAVAASTRTYSAVARNLVRDSQPDLLAVYLEGIDTLSHLFVRDAVRGPTAIARAYADADALMATLAAASTPETLMIVCSDHGFYPATAGIREDPSSFTGPATAWHRPYGIVAVATAGMLSGRSSDPQIDDGTGTGRVTPVDIAPTILHAAALAVPNDMPGRVITPMLPRNDVSRAVQRTTPPKYVPPSLPSSDRPNDREALARLQALGYVAGVKTALGRRNLAESYFRRGKLQEAERELRAVLQTQPADGSAMLWLAQVLQRQGRGRQALAVYNGAVQHPDGARDGLLAGVDLAIQERDLNEARRLTKIATRALGSSAQIDVALGAVAEAERDISGADRAYRRALKADPMSFEAAARLFDLVRNAGRAGEALAVIDRASKLAPESPRHLALLGDARLASGDVVGAERSLRRAVELSPDSDVARVALARALLKRGNASEAATVLLDTSASADRDTLLGAAYSALRDWPRAVEHLNAALNGGRSTAEVLNALGWAELQNGRPERAAAWFERSLAGNPKQPDIRALLTRIRAGKGLRP